MVEAAWSYRHGPAIGQSLAKRLEGQPPEVVAYAWNAQVRLSGRFHKLAPLKGLNKAVVAVARELAGFVWGMTADAVLVHCVISNLTVGCKYIMVHSWLRLPFLCSFPRRIG